MNKEAKFTKGEWLIDRSSHFNGYWGISVKDKGIAHYHFIEVLCKMDGEAENKGLEANAHLIKTAPKLYAEIESEIKFLTKLMTDNFTANCYQAFEICDRIASLKKVLAEARGEL